MRADFELGDSARVYAQGLYSDYSATAQLAATPVMNVFMPVDNPFVPDDLGCCSTPGRHPTGPS